MAVVGSAQVLANSGDGDFALGKYAIRRRYRVITDSLGDDEIVVTAATGLPRLFERYPTQALMRARHFAAERLTPSSLVWVVTVTYDTPENKEGSERSGSQGGAGKENDSQFENPLLEIPSVKFHSTSREELVTSVFDLGSGNLKPVSNSAGEAYDPPPKYLARGLTLEISRNEDIATNHPAIAVAYQNAVNGDYFWGLPPGTWMCKEITPERQQRQLPSGGTSIFLRTSYVFEARGDWDIIMLDKGSFCWLPPAGNTSNPYLPWLPDSNPYTPELPLPGTPALTPCTFRRFVPQTEQGHPCDIQLNGRGGPLPAPSTFVANVSPPNTITVPPPGTRTPGIYINQLAVMLQNTGGTLPYPLQPNTIYFVVNADAAGTTFGLAKTPIVSYGSFGQPSYGPGVHSIFIPTSPANSAGAAGILAGMLVKADGIAAGTTVVSVSIGVAVIEVAISTDPLTSVSSSDPGFVTFYSTGGATITIVNVGTGVHTIIPQGVFARLRPYTRKPFAALGLPQSFIDVQ